MLGTEMPLYLSALLLNEVADAHETFAGRSRRKRPEELFDQVPRVLANY